MKKRVAFFSICVALIMVLASSLIYAYYADINKGWQQEIVVGEVSLKLNGKRISSITPPVETKFSIGENYELDLELESTGTVPIQYTVHFALPAENDGGAALDQSLAPAIEVYRLDGGEYTFVSMLDAFVAQPLIGNLGAFEQYKYSYKLVYSLGAGSFYENKSFTLDVKAYSDVILNIEELPYYYISNTESFRQITNESFIEGKTIRLLNDLTLTSTNRSDFIFNRKVGIDLNGHKLDLNGFNIMINYDEGPDGKSELWKNLGIIDSSPDRTGSIVNSRSSGRLTVTCPNDVVTIGDSFSSATLGYLRVYQYSLEALRGLVNDQIGRATEKTITRMPNPASDTVLDFIDQLKFYFTNNAGAQSRRVTMALGASGNSGFLTAVTGNKFKISIWPEDTSVWFQTLNLVYGATTVSAHGYFRIQGQSLAALAEKLLEDIPDTVSGSIFMPSYDPYSGASIEWIVTDNDLLSDHGEYLPKGADIFDSYTDRQTHVGLIINREGEDRVERFRAGAVRVQVMNAADRTKKIFNDSNVFLTEVGDFYNLPLQIDEQISGSGQSITYTYTFTELQKAALKSIDITFRDNLAFGSTGSDDSDAYLSFSEYLNVENGQLQFQIMLDYKSQLDKAAKRIDIDYTFTYYKDYTSFVFDPAARRVIDHGITAREDVFDQSYTLDFSGCYGNAYQGAETVSHSMRKRATIVGSNQSQYAVDPTKELQAEFNPYYDGSDTYYDFYVKNKLTSELGIYYVISTPHTGYVYTDREEERTRIGIYKASVPQLVTEVMVYAYVEQAIYQPDATYYEKLSDTVFRQMTPEEAEEFEGTMYVQYEVFFNVTGILHNTPDDIADSALYYALLTAAEAMPNTRVDGWLTIHKARALTALTLRETSVTNLKGIEFFTSMIHFDLGNNSSTSAYANKIIDVSYLAGLVRLQYIDLANNRIADISAFTMMEALQTLNVKGNTIIDITPIQHLTSIHTLNLENNDMLVSFDGIQNMTGLRNLYVQNNNSTHTTDANMYFLTLLYINTNNLVNIRPFTRPTAEQIVGANVLKEMNNVYETHTTLNLPSSYNYNGKLYMIKWTASEHDRDMIEFYLENGVYKYRITSPIIDTSITLVVEVMEFSSSMSFNCSRNFYVNFLREDMGDNDLYLWTGSYYERLEDKVPDARLRSLLFRAFNESSTDTRTITLPLQTGSTTSLHCLVLTPEELGRQINEMLNWDNRGISDLSGLRYFQGITALKLQNNNFQDLSELSYILNLHYLYLDGKYFDFNQLVMNEQGVYYSDIAGSQRGLYNLYELHVYGSFSLNEEEVLTALYHIYRKNSSNAYIANGVSRTFGIYKDVDPSTVSNPNTVAWDPFFEPLQRRLRALTTTYNFHDFNEDWYITSDGLPARASVAGNPSNIFYQWHFYDDEQRGEFPLYFYFTTSGSYFNTSDDRYYVAQNTTTYYSVPCTNSTFAGTQGFWYGKPGQTYGNRLVYRDSVAYMRVTMQCANASANVAGHVKTTAMSNDIYFEFFLDFNNDIVIDDYVDIDTQDLNRPTVYTPATLSQAFPGLTLRRTIIEGIYSNTLGYPSMATIVSRKNRDKNGVTYTDGKYHLSRSDFASINLNAKIGGLSSADYASGTSYFGARTADGGFVSNNQTYAMSNSNIGTGQYWMEATVLGTGSPLKGLELLPATTRLYMPYEMDFGDGRHLIHLKEIYFLYSAPDLTKLDGDAIKKSHKYFNTAYVSGDLRFEALYKLLNLGAMRLRSFKLATYDADLDASGNVVAVRNIKSGFRYMPNLVNLMITNDRMNRGNFSYMNSFVGLATFSSRTHNPYYTGDGRNDINPETGAQYANQLQTLNLGYNYGSATGISETIMKGIWDNGYEWESLHDGGPVSRMIRSSVITGEANFTYYLPGLPVTGDSAKSDEPAKTGQLIAYQPSVQAEQDDRMADFVEDYGLEISNTITASDLQAGYDWSTKPFTKHFSSNGELARGGYVALPRYIQTFVGYNPNKYIIDEAHPDADANGKVYDQITSERKFPITWTIENDIFAKVGERGKYYQTADIYKANLLTYDYYVIFRGRVYLGDAINSSSGIRTPQYRTISYPVLVRGSSAALTYTVSGLTYYSYRVFDDPTMRYLVYYRLSASNYFNATYKGLISKTSGVDRMTTMDLNRQTLYAQVRNSTSAAYYYYNHWGYNVSGINNYIFSIKGIEYFTSVTSLTLTNQMITDISPLADLAAKAPTVLKNIYAEGNMIRNVDALQNFTNLAQVNLNYNYVETIVARSGANIGRCVLQKSFGTLTHLQLNYNPEIGAEDIASLKGWNINYLYVYMTRVAGSREAIMALKSVLESATRTTFYIGFTTTSAVGHNRANVLKQIDFIPYAEEPTRLGQYLIGQDRQTWQSNYTAGTIIGANPDYMMSSAPVITFLDPNVMSGGVLASGYTGMLRTNIRVAYIPQLTVDYEAKIFYSGESNQQFAVTINIGGTATEVNAYDYFDYEFVGYLAKMMQANNYTNLSNQLTQVDITSNIGLKTTKGFQYLTQLSFLRITNNPLLEVKQLPNTIVNLYLGSTRSMDASNLSALTTLVNLTRFDLEKVAGVDYEQTVNGTTLGRFLTSHTKLTYIYVNNDRNFVKHDANGKVNVAQTTRIRPYLLRETFCFNDYVGTRNMSTYNYAIVYRQEHIFGTSYSSFRYRYLTTLNLAQRIQTDYMYVVKGMGANFNKYVHSSSSSYYLSKFQSYNTTYNGRSVNFNYFNTFAYLFKVVANLQYSQVTAYSATTVPTTYGVAGTAPKLPFYIMNAADANMYYLNYEGNYEKGRFYSNGATTRYYYMDYDKPVFMPTYFDYYGIRIDIDYKQKIILSNGANDPTVQNGVFDFSNKLIRSSTFNVYATVANDPSLTTSPVYTDTTTYNVYVNYGYFDELELDTSSVQKEYEWSDPFDPSGLKVTLRLKNVSPLLSHIPGFSTEQENTPEGLVDRYYLRKDISSNYTDLKWISYDLNVLYAATDPLGTLNTVKVWFPSNSVDEDGYRMRSDYAEIDDIKVTPNAVDNTTVMKERDNEPPFFVQTTPNGNLERADTYFTSELFMNYMFNTASFNNTADNAAGAVNGFYYEEDGRYIKTTHAAVTAAGYYLKNGTSFTRVYKKYLSGSNYVINVNGTLYTVTGSGDYYYSNRTAVAAGHIANIREVLLINEKHIYNYTELGRVTSLTLYRFDNDNATYQSTTNLDGIQLFRNLTTLHLHSIPLDSIEPLRTLKLTTFSYQAYTSSPYLTYEIKDWSPLLGSKDTLTSFTYQSYYYFNQRFSPDDWTFLFYFTKLTTVNMHSYLGPNYMNYFNYLAALFNQHPTIRTFYVYGAYIINNGVVNNAYVKSVSSDYYKMLNVMEFYEMDSDTLVYDGMYRFRLTNRAAFSNGGNTAVAKLPVSINNSGLLYDIEYQSLSSYVAIAPDGTLTVSNLHLAFEGKAAIMMRITIDGIVFENLLTLELHTIMDADAPFSTFAAPMANEGPAYAGKSKEEAYLYEQN